MQNLNIQKLFMILGALLAGLSVALGAFGAHSLKKFADAETVGIYQTGVQYQMYHALALLAVGLMAERISGNLINYSGWQRVLDAQRLTMPAHWLHAAAQLG